MDSISVVVDNVPGPAIDSLLILQQIICNGDSNGVVTITVKEGAPPYTYSWSPTGGNSDTAYGLIAQPYTVTVTDANGCDTSGNILVPEPAALTANITNSPESCTFACNGIATASGSGGILPYSYQWDDPSLQNTATATGLCAGLYNVTVTDSIGCITTSSVTITSSVFSDSTSLTFVSCNGQCNGAAIITPVGGTAPYVLNFQRGDTIISFNANTITINNLCAGNYEIAITDTNQCNVVDTIVITEPDLLVTTTDSLPKSCGAIVRVSGGVPPYTYQWIDPSGQLNLINEKDTIVTNLVAGTFDVIVTDLNGCSVLDSVYIVCDCNPKPYTGFSPNSDEVNDLWIIANVGPCRPIEVIIFNRWGDVVWKNSDGIYDNKDVDAGHVWDGTYYRNGYPVPDGTYFYLIKVPDVRPKHGWVYIVR